MMKTQRTHYIYPIITGLIFLFSLPQANSQSQSDFDLIMERIYNTFQSTGGATLDNDVASAISTMTESGSWPDINYSSNSQTNWAPGFHFDRIALLAKAYSRSSSTYYGSQEVKDRMITAINYWLGLTPEPNSTNWFYRSISVPKAIGNTLIALRLSPDGISPSLESQMLNWMTKGTPITSSPSKDGSNLTDVAQHYIMRACLTGNQSLLAQTVTAVTNSVEITSGEGIQADHSFSAHGPQLYVYGYGREYISGITNIAGFVTGTTYAFSPQKLAIFSDFVRKGFAKPSRGAYADFNLFGRSISRPNSGRADVSLIERVKGIDIPEHGPEYENSIQRMRGLQPPSYEVAPEHIHYWRNAYTVHHRPGYMLGLRSVSTRNAKSEMGNGENIRGHYLTEGATYIAVNGDEYHNIFPVWEWNKVPGTTVPEITTYPIRTSWGANRGTAAFVGGVSDGTYGVSTYGMNDYQTSAKKSWFFFDEEIVCLGAGINSSAAEAINTTVNQCHLKTAVTVSDGQQTTVLTAGSHHFSNGLKWALQGNVGYFFPDGGNLSVSNQVQTGNWSSINTSVPAGEVSSDVFKLWLPHGIRPLNASYHYILTPGKSSEAEMEAYNLENIKVITNTSTIQAVKHEGTGIWQIVFHQAGELEFEGVKVKVNIPCAVLLKNLESETATIYVADPAQQQAEIILGLQTPELVSMKGVTFTLPQGQLAGSSVGADVTATTPDYQEPVEPVAQIVAISDAFVRSAGSGSTAVYGTTNYGSEHILTVKKESAGYDREVFLKFDLANLPSETDSLVLSMRVNNANTAITHTRWGFYLVPDNTWTEAGITWNNKPVSSEKLGEVAGMSAGNVLRLTLPSTLISNLGEEGLLSIRIASEPVTTLPEEISKTDASFNARENPNPAYRPQIFVYGNVPDVDETWKKDSLRAISDSYVKSNSPTTNYGSQGYLVTRNRPGDIQETFIKLDIGELPSQVKNARLRLWLIENSLNVTWKLYKASNSYSSSSPGARTLDTEWEETGITWNNKPDVESELTSINSPALSGYVYFDITAALEDRPADGILTLKIETTSEAYNSFRSVNFAQEALRPTLVYDYEEDNSLPVRLVYFKAETEAGPQTVNLHWKTSEETNNSYFEVERSDDARNFRDIAKVPGTLSPTGQNSYSYSDPDLQQITKNTVYYRLRQVDQDGSYTLSSVVSASLKSTEQPLIVGPNPASEKLSLFLNDFPDGALTLQVVSSTGIVVVEQTLTGGKRHDLDLRSFAPGLYIARVVGPENRNHVVRFAVSK